MWFPRIGLFLALLATAGLALAPSAAQAERSARIQVPGQGQDADWDIIRKSTEYLWFTAQGAAGAADGGAPIRNLYQAYRQFRGSQSLTIKNAEEINLILRQDGAEGGHVQDHGGQLRKQNVGFYENGQKVIDFPDWQTLPEKARYLGALLARVSTRKLNRDETIDASSEAHLIIGKQQLFADGNHRTARVVSDWILMRQGYPPAAHFALPKDSYEMELRVSQKGAMELFRRHMHQAVAASEAARGNRAPPVNAGGGAVDPAAGGGAQAGGAAGGKGAPGKPFGKADWTQDSPELEAPMTQKLGEPLRIQPAMRIAIAAGKPLWLDDKGRIWALN